MTRDFFISNWPAHPKLGDVMLLVIGVVGTSVAPSQLFFQQSYIVDNRITPRYMKYEKARRLRTSLRYSHGIVVVRVLGEYERSIKQSAMSSARKQGF